MTGGEKREIFVKRMKRRENMRKRIVCFTLAAAMLMSLAGCRSAEPAATEAATEASTAAEGGDSQEIGRAHV